MNILWQTELQQLEVVARSGSVLRLMLSRGSSGFALFGTFYDAAQRQWRRVHTSGRHVNDATQLLEKSLRGLVRELQAKDDQVLFLKNVQAMPFITAQGLHKAVRSAGLDVPVHAA